MSDFGEKKHTCVSCSTRFYELGRGPVCPVCGSDQRYPEQARPAPRSRAVVEEEVEEESYEGYGPAAVSSRKPTVTGHSWEYCRVSGFETYSFDPNGVRVEAGCLSTMSATEIANRLGSHGWEMVNVKTEEEGFRTWTEMHFKRRTG